MIVFARFSGEIWDKIFATTSSSRHVDMETLTKTDAKIQHWVDTVLPKMPVLPLSSTPQKLHLRRLMLVTTVRTSWRIRFVEADGSSDSRTYDCSYAVVS
jgi:hypothetical protein